MELNACGARCPRQRPALRHSAVRLFRRRAGMAIGRKVRAGGWLDGHPGDYCRPAVDLAVGPQGDAVKHAAVVGAGTMGNGIAHVFAQHGWQVALIDSAPSALDRATATIRSNLERQVKKGSLSAEAPEEILGRI